MRFDLITLFPRLFDSFLAESLMAKALEKGVVSVRVIDPRDFTDDRHHTADDRPFGGGPGMVLKPEPVARAIREALRTGPLGRPRVIRLTPGGPPLDQARVEDLAAYDHLVLVCGRYEGIDERVAQRYVDEDLSVGDFVLCGGEVPAMIVVEAVARLIPGVIGKMESTQDESFQDGLLEYPHYTRPRVFEGVEVPEVLLSGNHQAIRTWRLEQSIRRTLAQRPELIDPERLSPLARKVFNRLQGVPEPPRRKRRRGSGK
jgi:tRNA (guanine37-N1)-methyltransferase